MCVKCESECVLEDFVLEDFEGGDQHFSTDREDTTASSAVLVGTGCLLIRCNQQRPV